MSKLFIGGLSWNTDENLLRDTFSQHGDVVDCVVIKDRETGRSRGFGFVTYSSPDEARAAADALNDTELDGRRIRVDVAAERERPQRDNY